MKSDIDALMQAQNIDAILVTGPAQHNPAMVYFTGGGHLTGADLIKKRGEAPVLFHYPMERGEAAATGLPTRSLGDYRLADLLKQAGGDQLKATVERYRQMLVDLGITSGRLLLYGRMEAGAAYATFSGLKQALPELEIIGEANSALLMLAMATKDAEEVARIRKMGQITTTVVGQVADFLTGHAVKDGILVKKDGSPLTIGEVKSRINLWVAERGAENPSGAIFAIGRDAGIPHSSGSAGDFLRLGQTIVFDFFPCEAGGGYFYDFTRTWCLGYAPDEVQALYCDVFGAYQKVMAELKYGAPGKPYQEMVCDYFEARGHSTQRSNPQSQNGYVHGLGHGIGLNIHERPTMGLAAGDTDRLVAGVVITVEPGLYYPERGMGVRLEDSVWVRPDQQFEILSPFPLDLVLPMKGV